MIDLSIYVELMQILFTTSSAAFGAHRAALLADPSCQQALLNVLLHRVLPSLAAALEAAHMCNSIESGNIDSSGDGGASAVAVDSRRAFTVLCALPALLIAASGSPADRPPSKALRSRVCQLGGAGLVQHAARIIQALPLTRPEDMETEVFIQSQTAALHLLELTAVSMADVAEDGGPPSASEQGGSSGSGSAAAVVSASPEEQQEAAWHVVRLVPHLAELVRSLAADASFPANAMAIICIGFSRALLVLMWLRIASREQLVSYAAAADAALRLQPTLAPLCASWRQQGWDVPADLPYMLIHTLWSGSTDALHAWQVEEDRGVSHGSPAPVPAALARHMWQLHSSGCRLLHWLEASGDGADDAGLAGRLGWLPLLDTLNKHFEVACHYMAHWAAQEESGTQGPAASSR
jgi:hypothetical protein